MGKTLRSLGLIVVLMVFVGCSAGDDPADPRPQVLIIGDSISLGYTPFVAKLLQGDAKVVHCPGNARHTWYGRVWLDELLGSTHWDIIHFNWGLWDLCYRKPVRGGRSVPDKETGLVTVGLEEYRQNLVQLVTRLEKTGAVLIWASTTVVPPGDPGRFTVDAERYNAVAAEVMTDHGIRVNDLYQVSSSLHSQVFVAPGNVHFSAEGYACLGLATAREIEIALDLLPPRLSEKQPSDLRN